MVFENTLSQRISNRRRTDGIRVGKYHRIHYIILNVIQKMMAELECELEEFQGRIIFMSMFNDIKWRTPGSEDYCGANYLNIATYTIRFPFGHWSHLGLGFEKKWYGTHVNKPKW